MPADLSPATIEAALAGLRGGQLQVPPMYSALKRDGRPLYELARRGETVERAARPITIDRLELVAVAADRLEIEVTCSKGTYVRVLAADIAARLGTLGHLGALRRLWVEPFAADAMVTLDRIEADVATGQGTPDWLLPVDAAFPDLPLVRLDESTSLHLRQGRTIEPPAGLSDADGAAVAGLRRRPRLPRTGRSRSRWPPQGGPPVRAGRRLGPGRPENLSRVGPCG